MFWCYQFPNITSPCSLESLRDFIVFSCFKIFKIYQNTNQLVTASTLKNALNTEDCVIHDHRASIFTKHHYVNKRSLVLCTFLLTYVSYDAVTINEIKNNILSRRNSNKNFIKKFTKEITKELLLESVGLKVCWVMHVESSKKFFTDLSF